jgi:signal transduction histidine kinase
MDITSENKTIANLIRNFLITGGLSLAVFFFISIRLSRWAVRPVEFAWRQQKRFVADASHELKTPLTVILTNAGMLRANQYDPKLLPRLTDNILEEARQMRSLVENLLSLAKADDGLPKTERKKTDLSAAVLHECLLFEPLFYEKACAFTYDIEPGINVAGSELQLRQVVEILLDNACKYTAQGGKVTLGLKSGDAKHCLLVVENEGEEISPGQIELIFDRFYRGDKARSAGDGHGLGLSIASGIVRNHEGQIWAESSGGINRFCVKLRKLR